MIEFEFLKSVKSIRKLSRSRIRLMLQFLKNIYFETQKEGKGTRKLIFFTNHQYISTIRRRFARTCEWIYGIIHHILLVRIGLYYVLHDEEKYWFYYKWAKRTKFLFIVIYIWPLRKLNQSNILKKSIQFKIRSYAFWQFIFQKVK